ncbi:alpha/beta fold hydrolase [Paenibacillus gansuensis]|uniref:Alpha/beta fold hydrolase n=1 Tax=Paenibacillus gansuensis TaxID=306542 RepID=A0ABW5PHI6_9BACL
MNIQQHTLQTSKGKLRYHLNRNGRPHIVLINGGSGPIEGWMRILPGISETGSIFAYNRLGVAGSDKPKEPQDGRTIVETLREALSLVELEPPYLLIGHSLGGLYANLYARLYPEEAAGVILVEASHPKDLQLNEYQGSAVKSLNKIFSMFDSFSPHKQWNEVHFVKKTAEQLQTAGPFPDIPVYVITGGKENRMMPEEARKLRLNHQLELLTLSNRSKHIIAAKSGHFPQLAEPGLLIDTIKEAAQQISIHP